MADETPKQESPHIDANTKERDRFVFDLIDSRNKAEFERNNLLDTKASNLIGFVGIIIPHAVRLVWGPDYRFLLPLSVLSGAIFLILADLIARTTLAPTEVPIGVITAICGAPFFLYLLRRRKRAVFF